MIDNNQDGKADKVYNYGYDEKGRETFHSMENKNARVERNVSKQFNDNGQLKERRMTLSMGGEVDEIINKKIFYNEEGTILKEIGEKRYPNEIENSFLSGDEYEKVYYYTDTDQLLEIVGISNGEKFIHIKHEYEDEKLLSIKRSFRKGDIGNSDYYTYEDGVLKEIHYTRDTYYGGFR
jgi:hypothetical protein